MESAESYVLPECVVADSKTPLHKEIHRHKSRPSIYIKTDASSVINADGNHYDNKLKHADFKRCLLDGSFWNFYNLSKSPKDGHCALHSVISCLRFLFKNHSLSLHKLKELIIDECLNSTDKYINHFAGTGVDFFAEAEHYIYARRYNSGFCDILPLIISNILNIKVVVINHDRDGVNVYDFFPDECADMNMHCSLCKHSIASIVLNRRSDHFDACLPVIYEYEKHCDCFVTQMSK